MGETTYAGLSDRDPRRDPFLDDSEIRCFLPGGFRFDTCHTFGLSTYAQTNGGNGRKGC